jgi:putative ABC transport system permease protein
VEALAATLREHIAALDAQQAVTDVRTLAEVTAASVEGPRFRAWLLGLFALLALALAAAGLYGVMSYAVERRTREIGVRVALGAQGSDVLRLVIGEGLRLTLVGSALGVAASLALTRLMAGLLFGVSATDPLVFAGVTLTLAGVALAACWIPARRAAKVDPMIALRCE